MDVKKSLAEIDHESVFKDLREQLPRPWGALLPAMMSGVGSVNWVALLALASAGWIGNGLAANHAPGYAILLGVFILLYACWFSRRGEAYHASCGTPGSHAAIEPGACGTDPPPS